MGLNSYSSKNASLNPAEEPIEKYCEKELR